MKHDEVARETRPDSVPPDGPDDKAPGTSDAHRVPPGSAEHRENQEELGVGPDHRTEDMKRGHRGTFP